MRDLSSSSDSDLLAKARRDPEAFHEFYRRHCFALDSWLRKETGDLDVAAELTAETFAQAWFGLGGFKGTREDGVRWLYGIARNLARQYFRKRRVESTARRKLNVEVTGVAPDQNTFEQITHRLPAPELLAAIECLPESERQALILRVVSELSYRDVAERLECSENAARLRVSKALRRLRTNLGGDTAQAGGLLDGGIADERSRP
jgi:RNA polymerase sigma factor (sigma-70 family)